MSRRLRMALGLATILTMAVIALGTAVPKATTSPANSPYVSALASVGVGTAEAARRCTAGCEALQGIYFCRFEGTAAKCAVVNGVCTETPCGH